MRARAIGTSTSYLLVEVVVEAAARDVGGVGDVVEGDGIDPALGHELLGDVEDPLARVRAAPGDAAGGRGGLNLGHVSDLRSAEHSRAYLHSSASML